MTKEELKEKIEAYEEIINDPTEDQTTRDFAAKKVAKLKDQIAPGYSVLSSYEGDDEEIEVEEMEEEEEVEEVVEDKPKKAPKKKKTTKKKGRGRPKKRGRPAKRKATKKATPTKAKAKKMSKDLGLSVKECEELLEKYSSEDKARKSRLAKRKKAGKTAELSVSESLEKEVKTVKNKVEDKKTPTTKAQAKSQGSKITDLVKAILEGIDKKKDKITQIDAIIKGLVAEKKKIMSKKGTGTFLVGTALGGYAGYKLGLSKDKTALKDLFKGEKKLAKDFKDAVKDKKKKDETYTEFEEIYAKGGILGKKSIDSLTKEEWVKYVKEAIKKYNLKEEIKDYDYVVDYYKKGMDDEGNEWSFHYGDESDEDGLWDASNTIIRQQDKDYEDFPGESPDQGLVYYGLKELTWQQMTEKERERADKEGKDDYANLTKKEYNYKKGGKTKSSLQNAKWEYPLYFTHDNREFVAIYYSNEEDVNEADEDFDNRTYNDLTPDVIKEYVDDTSSSKSNYKFEERDVYELSKNDNLMGDLEYALETSTVYPEKVEYARGGSVEDMSYEELMDVVMDKNSSNQNEKLAKEIAKIQEFKYDADDDADFNLVVQDYLDKSTNKNDDEAREVLIQAFENTGTSYAKGGKTPKFKVRKSFYDKTLGANEKTGTGEDMRTVYHLQMDDESVSQNYLIDSKTATEEYLKENRPPGNSKGFEVEEEVYVDFTDKDGNKKKRYLVENSPDSIVRTLRDKYNAVSIEDITMEWEMEDKNKDYADYGDYDSL